MTERGRGRGERSTLGVRLTRLASAAWMLCAVSTSARAQVPLLYSLDADQNPRGIAWRRIETPHFAVIYPDSLGAEAQRVARLLEATYAPLRKTLPSRRDRIPVVLNDRSMTSNAFVSWAPRHSRWYSLPPTTVDQMGPVDWYTLLASHEGRHIVQQDAVRTGLVGFFDRLFGDNTTAFLGGALYVPSWYWEGDAVATETALTDAGRGRQPSFTQRIRALRAAGKPYEYWPAWEGSYRTYYPDWYELGFVLTTHVKAKYGADAWPKALKRATRNPLAPLALSQALKHVTGRTLVQLQREAIATLDTLWTAQRAALSLTSVHQLSPADPSFHNWLQPQYAGDGSIIATYSDLSTVKRLERIRDGKRDVLVRNMALPGELQFHVRGDRVVWSEYEVSPRWGEESFLVVKRLDLTTKRITQLTHRSRYYSPALSPNAERIVAVHFSLAREATLVILDAASGRELQRLPSVGGAFLVTPTWSNDGKSIFVVVVDSTRGNALLRVRLDGTPADTIVPFTHEAISRPTPVGGEVIFGSPRSGIDNIYAVDTATRRVRQLTSRPFGAMWASPSPDGSRIVFSDYSVRGYDIAEAALGIGAESAVLDKPSIERFFEPVVAQESRIDSVPSTRQWSSIPYRGASTLFDFHSLTIAPTSDAANAGLALESRNVLNTFGLSVGATFNVNERTGAAEIGASYAGLPVIFDVAGRLGSRASSYADTAGIERGFSWREQSLTTSLRLPLTRLRGLTRQSLVATASVGLTHISDQPVAFRNENNNGNFTPATYSLSAFHLRPAAYRDLYPTGVVATALYRHTPFGSDYRSHQASIRGAMYFPGFFANHALVVDAARELQDPTNYRFSSQYLFPRGYSSRFHERFTRVGVSYYLPLSYPDLALGPWVYVRRLQGGVFGDAGRGSTRTGNAVADYRSAGAELTADISPFGLRETVRTGVRYSRTLINTNRNTIEWIISLF